MGIKEYLNKEVKIEEGSNTGIDKIAKDVLGISTLKTRNSDSKDFYDLAVWDIKKALELASKSKMNESSDDLNPRYMFTGMYTELLVKLASGKVNAQEYAKFELQNRGFDASGNWIGFPAAKKLWKSKVK